MTIFRQLLISIEIEQEICQKNTFWHISKKAMNAEGIKS
jgi:hypothetical protein